MNTPSEQEIIVALKSVEDPEMHIDVHTLGLIYNITRSDEGVEILMTLTTPFCPYADQIVQSVESAVERLGTNVKVTITFKPQWVPPEDLRIALGI